MMNIPLIGFNRVGKSFGFVSPFVGNSSGLGTSLIFGMTLNGH